MGDKNWEEGYSDGQDDQKSGNGKRWVVRPLKRLARVDSFLPGGEHRMGNYYNGYSTGYEDSVRVVNTVSGQSKPASNASVSERGGAMSGSNSYEFQLELLHELHNFLKSIQDQLDDLRSEYGRRVNDLRDAGMIAEHHEYLQRNIFNPTEGALLKFIDHLQIRDITTVRREIGYVEAEIERLRSYDE